MKLPQGTSGTRLEAQVEVGGWPLPDIFWFKDDEPLETKMHTENYNGCFNAYVPERKVEVSRSVVYGYNDNLCRARLKGGPKVA